MCELFGMSSRFPAEVGGSLGTLFRRGGEVGPHADGWGIAYLTEGDVRLIRTEASAAADPWAAFLRDSGLESDVVVGHIRKATLGQRTLRNTQPFSRELGGRMHVFAHNGHMPGIRRDPELVSRTCRTVGDTDSEHAFCALVDLLRPAWEADEETPPLDVRLRLVSAFAARLRPHGPANFLYTDGDTLFAHADQRTQEDGEIRAPGLHLLERRCDRPAGEEQRVTVLASVPLSGEGWQPMARGTVLALRGGRVAARSPEPA